MRVRSALLVLLVACSGTPAAMTDLGALPADTDGDGLLDVEEGYADGGGPDTDGDGVPDGEDVDTDADGLPDAIEALPRQESGAPSDVNGDGRPDFRVPDCDGNGRLDGVDAFLVGDAHGDLDGTGVADFRDPDDDGDTIPDAVELGPDPLAPWDTDADGAPDFRDLDADSDTIRDVHEVVRVAPDQDLDGVPNHIDLDADGDGYPDAQEAGDDDPRTPPVDTDGDGQPDFVDVDSDGDGVFDATERELNLSPLRADSDEDGTPDWLEVWAGTDGADPADDPRARGTLLALAPFRGPPEPEAFPARVRFALPETASPPVVGVSVRDVTGGAALLERIQVDPGSEGCDDLPATDTNDDGLEDTFAAPPGGSQLCWRVVLRENRTVAPGNGSPIPECWREGAAKILRADLEVQADDAVRAPTPFVGLVAPDTPLIGPDDPRCHACETSERCRRLALCPCL